MKKSYYYKETHRFIDNHSIYKNQFTDIVHTLTVLYTVW